MRAAEIARKMAALSQKEDAINAYKLVLQSDEAEPAEQLEAAVYILHAGGDHRISCTAFLNLYGKGYFQEEILQTMTDVFYKPNEKIFKKCYERNCKLLSRYPYFFRTDFLPFEELPIRFLPYDEKGFLPFFVNKKQFGQYVSFEHPVVTQNFFKNLDDPICAQNVFSQYELLYLNDNVRKSEFVGRDNHIYLRYSDWGIFCAYLQCLKFKKLLEDKKFVFLMEDEVSQYPINFKERFGIDYSKFPVKPVDITEINRLIWHVQFSTHNGGDFFDQVFDGHPNIISVPSILLSDAENLVGQIEQTLALGKNCLTWTPQDGNTEKLAILIGMLRKLKKRTKKDLFVAGFMYISDLRALDQTSRIAPVIFFQPHFHNIRYSIGRKPDGTAIAFSPEYDNIHHSSLFNGFPYIKTFAPVRRFTTSYAASVRYSYKCCVPQEGKAAHVVGNLLMQRTLNRSYLIDPEQRLYMDSRLVRFEDGKLNPKATFTALAAFLDLPYTNSMAYCSMSSKKADSPEREIIAQGFDTANVYQPYDEFANDNERYFMEYFLREAYEYCGYDFHYYDGRPVDLDRAKELIQGFTTLRHYIEKTYMASYTWYYKGKTKDSAVDDETAQEKARPYVEKIMNECEKNWLECAEMLLQNLKFLNSSGQPLHMMPKLELDPELLEGPIYH